MLTPNRIVAVLTPLVFAPLAGAICAWVADNVPGVNPSPERLTNIFIAGALLALPPALQWLHGWQQWEKRVDEAQRAVDLANSSPPEPPPVVTVVEVEHDEDEDGALAALDELEDLAPDDAGEFYDPLLDEEDELARPGA